MSKPRLILLLATTFLLYGCVSHIEPLLPLQKVETWVPDDQSAATQPSTEPAATLAATEPASQPATLAATQAATQPGHLVTRTIDPNQTSRFVYKATYDTIWQQAMLLLHNAGFTLDRQDYRLGVLSTAALPSAQVIEFWKPEQTNANNALENTVNSQRRTVRVTISKADKPDFYQIAIQVLVERQTNPGEAIGGPIFVEGSGFGRNAITLRSDYADPTPGPSRWTTMGHDPDLERKLLDALFQHI